MAHLAHAAPRSRSGKTDNSNFFKSWVKTYSNYDFSRSLDNKTKLFMHNSQARIVQFVVLGSFLILLEAEHQEIFQKAPMDIKFQPF